MFVRVRTGETLNLNRKYENIYAVMSHILLELCVPVRFSQDGYFVVSSNKNHFPWKIRRARLHPTLESTRRDKMNSFGLNTNSWFEALPLTDYDGDKSMLLTQLGETRWSSKIQFYREVRSPRSVRDLMQDINNKRLIWINKECFIVRRPLPTTVPQDSTFRNVVTIIEFASEKLRVYGKSDDNVARAIEYLLCLKNEEGAIVRIGTRYIHGEDSIVPTSFLTSQFLRQYMEENPQGRLILGRACHLSEEQSIVLASHHEPLNVGIECVFENGGRAFVETLSQRTSDFGTLSLHSESSECQAYKVFLDVMGTVHNITLHTGSLVFKGNEHLPMSSVAKRVEYKVWNHMHFDRIFEAIEPFTVVPKAFTVVFEHSVPVRFHTMFLQGSGNVRELGMIYDFGHQPSLIQQRELFQAIATNQNLHRLELGCFAVLGDFWTDLLEVLGSRESLRSVVFFFRREPDLRRVETLVPFMKTHIHLDITFKSPSPWAVPIAEADAILEPVRLKNRARSLTRDSVNDRPAIFGAALTAWAGGNVLRTSILLTENTDVLCLMIDQPSSPPSRVETLKRNAHPFAGKQKKISKTES